MNKRQALATLMMLPAFAPLQAADNLITNGDFEAGPKEAPVHAFYESPGWYNRAEGGKRQDAQARRDSENLGESTYNALINNKVPVNSIFHQKTGHIIKEGEIYNLSLDWKHSFQWRATDLLRVRVYATLDNKVGGTVIWEDVAELDHPSGEEWARVKHAFAPVPLDAQGKNLHFSFEGVGAQETLDKKDVGFARVDNIVLEVAEP